MVQKQIKKERSFFNMLLVGGFAGLIAEVATLPIDTMKVRM